MIKRQALSTRPKVQTSNSICREGVHPLQAVMKYLLTLTIGPRTHNQILKPGLTIIKLRVSPQLLVMSHSLGHHCVCVLQAFSAPASLDLVWTEVVDAAAAVQLLFLAQALVRGRDVIVATPQSPRGDTLSHCLEQDFINH